jgi:hypothetical protein
MPHLSYSLIPPFQMRENDVIVNDRPKFQTRNLTEDDHCVIASVESNRQIEPPNRIAKVICQMESLN